jgi:phosphate transport system substrate-binding protein
MSSLTDSKPQTRSDRDDEIRQVLGLGLASANFLRATLRYFLVVGLTTASLAAAQSSMVVLVGSGSTVPAPLYQRWSEGYGKHNPKIQMRYLPVGTGEGIRQITHGIGDFAAGEARLTDRHPADLIALPTLIIAIVPIYKLPRVEKELRFSGEVLADIFLGVIKTWNAPELARINPDISLPNLPIRVVVRPSGKGSNYIFTDFLSKTSSKFRSQIGTTSSPRWPVGESTDRSSDMVDRVQNTPGAIGYVEYQYAVKNGVTSGAVLNSAGRFVRASGEGLTAACRSMEAPNWSDFSASLTAAPGGDSYPIASFTWIYIPAEPRDPARATALADFLRWVYIDGQAYARDAGYTELPPEMVIAVRKKIKELR